MAPSLFFFFCCFFFNDDNCFDNRRCCGLKQNSESDDVIQSCLFVCLGFMAYQPLYVI